LTNHIWNQHKNLSIIYLHFYWFIQN